MAAREQPLRDARGGADGRPSARSGRPTGAWPGPPIRMDTRATRRSSGGSSGSRGPTRSSAIPTRRAAYDKRLTTGRFAAPGTAGRATYAVDAGPVYHSDLGHHSDFYQAGDPLSRDRGGRARPPRRRLAAPGDPGGSVASHARTGWLPASAPRRRAPRSRCAAAATTRRGAGFVRLAIRSPSDRSAGWPPRSRWLRRSARPRRVHPRFRRRPPRTRPPAG